MHYLMLHVPLYMAWQDSWNSDRWTCYENSLCSNVIYTRKFSIVRLFVVRLFTEYLTVKSLMYMYVGHTNTLNISYCLYYVQKTVVTTKSVEYMPFFLSFFFFINGGVWTFYAWLLQDVFLGVNIYLFSFI